MAYGTMMNRSPSSSGLLPMPGSPGSSWAVYKERFRAIFRGADTSVLIAFWLFGLINNVCYVIILSAALDLVGPSVPKSVVLLADVLPSFLTKLVAPYFIHNISYPLRIIIMCALSAGGMFIIALTPLSIPIKLFGVAVASFSSGMGELSLLGLTHYYGHFSLAAWGSGTGGAGLIGAGLYVLLTSTIALSVKTSLLACAFLPFILPMAFFFILPQGPLKNAHAHNSRDYEAVPQISISDEDIQELPIDAAASSLLAPGPSLVAEAYTSHSPRPSSPNPIKSFSANQTGSKFMTNLRRTKSLFIPYMAPLLLVYIAEYTINQGVTPTLLFPINSSPFDAYRSFYPTYALIYQLGVFISRSSSPFFRFHALYLPSLLQIANLFLLIFHSIYFFIPSVWIVFLVIFWEGLLGGLVYISTFAEIMDNVPVEEREFSLGATSVSDSGGICIASLLGMVIEPWLCGVNVGRGRPWCRSLGA